jgi:hypothetical protein
LSPAFGDVQSKEVRLIGRLAREAHLQIRAIDEGGPEAKVLAAGNQRPQGLRLTLAGKRVDRRVGRVLVSTGLVQPKELSLPYAWRVRGNLEVSPSNPYFNLRDPDAQERTVTVTSARPDFRLLEAAVIAGPFQARIERGPAAMRGYVVRISVVESGIPPGERGVQGKLLLVSNDPAEPKKELPLFALGAVRPAAKVAP